MASRETAPEVPLLGQRLTYLCSLQAEPPPTSGAFPGFFKEVWRASTESLKTSDWVAVLGGCSERVSAIKFPDLRENTGNLVGIRPSSDGGRQRLQGIAG